MGTKTKLTAHFTLVRKQVTDAVQYIVSNDGECAHDGTKKSSGFGMQYIKSRLEESYAGKWKVESQNNSGHWEVSIEIRKK